MTSPFLAFGLLTSLLLGCGIADERTTSPQSLKALLSDSELTKESVNANLTDAMDALVDTNVVQASGSTLALSGGSAGEHDDSKRSRTCVEEGDKAVVTLSTEVDRGFSHQGKRISIAAERTGSTKIVRTWSKEGAAVACKDEKRANIDMSGDITGLALKAEFERSMARSFSLSKKSSPVNASGSGSESSSSAKEVKKSVSISAKGSREVKWTSHLVNSDGTTTRSKTVVSSVNRTHKRLDKSGQEQALSLSIEVSKDDPLKIEVTYEGAAKERQLLSKVISSGTMTSTRSGDGKIVSSFAKLKLSFDADDCKPESGEMTTKIYVEGATEPSKIYLLKASEGDYLFQDVTDPNSPVDVEDVDFEVCDIADHKD